MKNRQEHLEKLRIVVERSHNCSAIHHESMSVCEIIDGRTWNGDVEIFRLKNHPSAHWCYAWNYQEGDEQKVAAVLQVPPVISPNTAVRISLVEDARKPRNA